MKNQSGLIIYSYSNLFFCHVAAIAFLVKYIFHGHFIVSDLLLYSQFVSGYSRQVVGRQCSTVEIVSGIDVRVAIPLPQSHVVIQNAVVE